ncbi:MAG: DNA primase [Treponema sp.]|nr:DNA primase [Treponema sp.]
MRLISKSTIQEVNNRLNAISIVEDYVRLEKKSGRWWGRCPFHGGGQEKTPSFKVDPDLKMYHCFGCGKGGSIIGFIMEMDKLTYPEAIRTLAKKIGIEIVYEDGGAGEDEFDNTKKEELFELYRRTTVTFQHFLKEKPEGQNAYKYLIDRSISEQMIERFKLGFSPSDRNFLYHFLKQKGYSEDFLDKSGLFSARYKASPMFSGRLMFPITDRQSRVAAFGGRALPGVLQSDGKEPPKYINSPETDIYKKGQTLYALDLALPEIRQTKTVYIAEGYMDVIALHQAGVTNAVAPLGTAFTDEQASLLHRWAERVIIVFDTDEAGQKAAYKAILTCRKNGIISSIAQLQEGLKRETGSETAEFKDPAEILQKFSPQILKKIMDCTINDFEYLIFRGKSQFKSAGSAKNRAVEFLFPYLDALNSEIERGDCTAIIADAFGVERDAVQKDYSRWKKGTRQEIFEKQINVSSGPFTGRGPVRMNAELFLLTVVSVNMKLYPDFRAALEIKEIDDPDAKELFIALEECFVHDESDIDSLLSRITNEPLKNFIASRGSSAEFSGGPGREPRRLMEDGITEIRKKRLRKRLTEISAEMRISERYSDDDSEYINELLAEKKYIDSQMRELDSLMRRPEEG